MKLHLLIGLLAIILISTIGCSKAPSPEDLEIQKQAKPVVDQYMELKVTADELHGFAAIKKKWEEESLSNPVADELRKKLVQYLDMRIGVIQGAPQIAVNKCEQEFDEMIDSVQDQNHIKLK